MRRSLLYYSFFLLLIFAALECVYRLNYSSILVLGDKPLIKNQILKQMGLQEIAFYGSSRTNDSVDGFVVSKSLKELLKKEAYPVYNVATAGIGRKRYFYTLEQALAADLAKNFVIEIGHGVRRIKDFTPPDQAFSAPKTAEAKQDLETQLQEFFYSHLALVRLRKTLNLKSLSRILLLWISPYSNTERWFRTGVLKSFFIDKDVRYRKPDFASSLPKVYRAGALDLLQKVGSSPELSDLSDFHQELYGLLKSYSSNYIFMNTPVAPAARSKECNLENQKAYLFMINNLNAKVLDFSCLDFPEKYFKDDKHLNSKGRVYFSQLVSEVLYKEKLLELGLKLQQEAKPSNNKEAEEGRGAL